ncbi:MAG: hypothetical protein IJT73_05815 [Selenomonadaceae bacterium]|nr:hypothetical protein [Selenomonadaceae bacterium]
MVEDFVKSIVVKIASMQPAEFEILSKAICTTEKVKKIEFMENEYSENYS